MQVSELREALPLQTRVGTVDKFQGQEAPVVLYSMAASSSENAHRGIEFLYELNRFNVAISPAQGLVLSDNYISPSTTITSPHREESFLGL